MNADDIIQRTLINGLFILCDFIGDQADGIRSNSVLRGDAQISIFRASPPGDRRAFGQFKISLDQIIERHAVQTFVNDILTTEFEGAGPVIHQVKLCRTGCLEVVT